MCRVNAPVSRTANLTLTVLGGSEAGLYHVEVFDRVGSNGVNGTALSELPAFRPH